MKSFRKRVFAAAGFTTVFMGSGRKEFNPSKPLRPFEEYLKETAEGTCAQLGQNAIEEGIIGSFMSSRFIKQANLPGFLPYMVPQLQGRACTAVEGACGTGGRAIAMGLRSVLSDISDTVFVTGFEMQNAVKAVYGADILAGAAYYAGERKNGEAFFFPGIFAERAGAYYQAYGYDEARRGMAKWYEQSILNARKNPKAQEYQNTTADLFGLAMAKPDPAKFVPNLNQCDCSKVTDGATSLIIASEEGLKACGVPLVESVEIIGLGEAEADITRKPGDLTLLSTTVQAVVKALTQARITKEELALLELHDCFSITALLALEAIGFAERGKAPAFILEGKTAPGGMIPTNLSGGLSGFGHPTGASGVRQLVDLLLQSTGKAANKIAMKTPFGMMISMGGNDKTVTCIITKRLS